MLTPVGPGTALLAPMAACRRTSGAADTLGPVTPYKAMVTEGTTTSSAAPEKVLKPESVKGMERCVSMNVLCVEYTGVAPKFAKDTPPPSEADTLAPLPKRSEPGIAPVTAAAPDNLKERAMVINEIGTEIGGTVIGGKRHSERTNPLASTTELVGEIDPGPHVLASAVKPEDKTS